MFLGNPDCLSTVCGHILCCEAGAERREEGRPVPKPQQELSGRIEVTTLVSICSSCRRIRDEAGQWRPLGLDDLDKGRLEFSHGICEDCAEALYPQYFTKSR